MILAYLFFKPIGFYCNIGEALYAISAYNHQQGIRYWSFQRGWNYLKAARRHFKKLEQLDLSGI